MRAELEKAGAPAEYISRYVEARRPAPFYIYTASIKVLSWFRLLDSQWRVSAAGQPMGLDYSGVKALFDIYEVTGKEARRLFEDLRRIELGHLTQWQKNSLGNTSLKATQKAAPGP